MRKADREDFQLTRRERQILELTAHGLSAKEVAQTIHIAPRTVEGYINMIRVKLQARNRAHMVAKALTAKLIIMDRHPRSPAAPSRREADFDDRGEATATKKRQPRLGVVDDKWPTADPGPYDYLFNPAK